MDFPDYSPNINLIENFWPVCQVYIVSITVFSEIQTLSKTIFYSSSHWFLKNLQCVLFISCAICLPSYESWCCLTYNYSRSSIILLIGLNFAVEVERLIMHVAISNNIFNRISILRLLRMELECARFCYQHVNNHLPKHPYTL